MDNYASFQSVTGMAALPLLVFSDLDGTLLDHETYNWEAAKPGLARLKSLGAGLVLASSKTAVEIAPLRVAIGFPQFPAIVENGAGLLPAEGMQKADLSDYADIRATLVTLGRPFKGFGDMTDVEVAQATGLPLEDAQNAKRRAFSEPGLWTGPQEHLQDFIDELADHGLSARSGGRFLTISKGRTKGDAVTEVIATLAPGRTVALGDAPNDLEMLAAASIGVIVKNPASPGIPPQPQEQTGQIIRTQKPGPQGWSEAILRLTDDLT
ncbi:MAG: HAD-IIB family hydrolase [Pseudomonadota bacterium]